MNATKRVHKSPITLKTLLEKDLQITNSIIRSYNERLQLELPFFLLSHQNQLGDILTTVNDINKAFHHLIGDAIKNIDRDQYEWHQSSSTGMVKILNQFKLVTQSQNEAYLDCACDAAIKLDTFVQDFVEKFYLCVNITSEQLSNYLKDTITPIANSMETTIQSITRGIKRSKTSVEVFYQLPMEVSKPFDFLKLFLIQIIFFLDKH